MNAQPRVLYVLQRFPVPSETFVTAEALGMRERGLLAGIVSLVRPTEDELARVGPGIGDLLSKTIYLPTAPWRFAPTALRAMITPEFARAAERLRRQSSSHASSVMRQLRAAAVADTAHALRATFLYAHWPRPSEVAHLASIVSGLPYGVSVHAHEVAHDAGHFPAVLERARFAAFCNEAARERLASSLDGRLAAKHHLVYHGVDFSRFPQRPAPPLDGGLRIVSAGRLTPTKGFDRLIDGVAATHRKGIDVRLAIFGDGADRARLEMAAADAGIEDRVRFEGWAPHERMPEAFASAHLFALLADDNFHDGLPNAVLEAMATGRPAIVSPLPAAREAIRHGWNGHILSAVNAIDEFADVCAALAGAPDRLRAQGEAAASSVRLHHDKRAQLNRLAALFYA